MGHGSALRLILAMLLRTEILEGPHLVEAPPPQSSQPLLLIPSEGGGLYVTDDDLQRHTLFLGAIGSGKTNAISHYVSGLRNVMTGDDVMIIFDTKGDYLRRFRQPGDAVISSSTCEGNVIWNLLSDMYPTYRVRDDDAVFETVTTLFEDRLKHSNNPFFPRAAADLVASSIIALARDNSRSSNADLRALFDRSGPRELRALIGSHDDLRGATVYIGSDNAPQTYGVMGEAQGVVRETFVGRFKMAGQFSVSEFVHRKGGAALFVEYDIARGATLTPIYRVLIDLALKEALSRNRSEGNVYVVLDEFSLLPGLSYIDTALNFGRELGLRCLVGAQNVGQVYGAYGEHRALSILSGFGTVMCFRVLDAASRGLMIERHGSNRKQLVIQGTIGTAASVAQPVVGSVIEDWDLTTLPTGSSVVSRSTTSCPFRVTLRMIASVASQTPARAP